MSIVVFAAPSLLYPRNSRVKYTTVPTAIAWIGKFRRQSSGRTVAIDSTYVAGRARPDVVIPADAISTATPRGSSAVALLVQVGHGNAALSTDPAVTSYTNRAGLLIRTSVTIILTLPATVAAFYGMNVSAPLGDSPHAFALIIAISFGISGLAALLFWRRNYL
jgi:hypothetical protein